MRAVVLMILVSCATANSPVKRPADAQRLELVEGTPTTLGDGTVVEIKGILYAHMADGKNLSSCMLVLRRGSEHAELPLAREHGGSDPESSGSALGWDLTLEVADPYRRPSRAVILAVPRHTGH